MFSFKKVTFYLPQCGLCNKPACDAQGNVPQLDSEKLPGALERHLLQLGWSIRPPHLRCPDCEAAINQRARRLHDQLGRPFTTTVDMADRIGPGWIIGQRGIADKEEHRWIVKCGDTVAGVVEQYQRADYTFSDGWRAVHLAGDRLFSVEAIGGDSSWSKKSNFLWRTRDLAVWGIAVRPGYGSPLPLWALRKKRAG